MISGHTDVLDFPSSVQVLQANPVLNVSNLTKSPSHGQEAAEKCNLGGSQNRSCSTTTFSRELYLYKYLLRGQNGSECPIWTKPEPGCFLWH
ncbi:hypothetical protein CsSME_00048681 [Camellia sinensis var. sinensis]